ncbi:MULTISPECIES: redoxin domain-containing protein [unclassified Mycoplasma]|uniref:redoxin domain-containing protein n=1 Tax=unclassified Mycoplasma TaxID=2683645 RepID=UPI00211D0EA6|nr:MULTISPECIES: redoxin domain-containing protein [unclassified Mycoplasma]UUM19713.1 redoxin domain-containing protein [Mycoplasma sp. 1578d]UUM24696.1 redoxin domain-containing protein [Mycoplasma sp. 3686d]
MNKVNFLNDEYTLLGTEAKLGDKVMLKGVLAGTFNTKDYENNGKYTVVVVFPSIDTRVCDMQVALANSFAQEFENVNFVSFSQDLPTALASYIDQHKITKIQMFSDYKHREMALSLGLLIDQLFLNARAMLVLDKDNNLVYKQVNKNVHEQVDFDSLREFLSKI